MIFGIKLLFLPTILETHIVITHNPISRVATNIATKKQLLKPRVKSLGSCLKKIHCTSLSTVMVCIKK